MYRGIIMIGAVVVVLAAASCGGGGGGAPTDSRAAEGLADFRQTCAVCHGQNGEGMPRLGKELHGNAFVASKTDDELMQFLKEGRPAGHPDNERGVDMPPKGGNPAITDTQLASIIAYMRSIQ